MSALLIKSDPAKLEVEMAFYASLSLPYYERRDSDCEVKRRVTLCKDQVKTVEEQFKTVPERYDARKKTILVLKDFSGNSLSLSPNGRCLVTFSEVWVTQK